MIKSPERPDFGLQLVEVVSAFIIVDYVVGNFKCTDPDVQ